MFSRPPGIGGYCASYVSDIDYAGHTSDVNSDNSDVNFELNASPTLLNHNSDKEGKTNANIYDGEIFDSVPSEGNTFFNQITMLRLKNPKKVAFFSFSLVD